VAIKIWQSRETGNIRYTRRRKTKQEHNTVCVGHHHTQTNTNNVNKTLAPLQTTGGKDEQNIIFIIYKYPVIKKNHRIYLLRRDHILFVSCTRNVFDISYVKRGILRSVTTEAPYIKHL